MKKPRFPRLASDAIDLSSLGRLTAADYAAIDSLTAYTLSPENEARNALRRRIGAEALERADKFIGDDVQGADRLQRYEDLQKAFSSRVFLTGDKSGDGDAGDLSHAATAADGNTPTSNTGVTSKKNHDNGESDELDFVRLVIGSGKKTKLLEVPARRGHNGSAAFCDWVHITIGKETCDQYADFIGTDEERVLLLSYRLERIFGFGVTCQHKAGRNFYRESWGLGHEREQWGYVCIGGQEETILIGITGTGCTAAERGWEQRLVDWLQNECERPKLTRVDLAYDDFTGETYNTDKMQADFQAGGYRCFHAVDPHAERIGTDWIFFESREKEWADAVREQCGTGPVQPLKPSKRLLRGRTFAVGRRASGKYARGYERGRKLGDSNSPWFRIEVEHKAVERVLPFDMLLEPGKYLAASYPALNWISEDQCRIQMHKKQLQITLQSSIEFVKHQAGQHINVLLEALGPDGFVDAVRRDGIPKRFKVADLDTAPNPIRISDRLQGMTSKECNSLLDMHLQGLPVPGAFFGHRSESPSFRPH